MSLMIFGEGRFNFYFLFFDKLHSEILGYNMNKTTVYKLTDSNNQTQNNTQWGEGVEHKTSGEGDLCSEGFLHCYSDPLLASFLHPMHVSFENPVLWEAEGSGVMKDDNGLKVGFSCLKTLKKMELPVVSDVQRIAFGILCALEVEKDVGFVKWANEWLSGEDRSAEAAGRAARAATWAEAAAKAATWAAEAAKSTARAAEMTARAAARAAGGAAKAATWAAEWTARAGKTIDLVAIAKEAMKY